MCYPDEHLHGYEGYDIGIMYYGGGGGGGGGIYMIDVLIVGYTMRKSTMDNVYIYICIMSLYHESVQY